MDKQFRHRLTCADRGALRQVRAHLLQAYRAWSQIPDDKRRELLAEHPPEGSLAVCLGRGVQLSEELILLSAGATRI